MQCPGKLTLQNFSTGVHWNVKPKTLVRQWAHIKAPTAIMAYRNIRKVKVRQYSRRRDPLINVTVAVWRKKNANTVLVELVSRRMW